MDIHQCAAELREAYAFLDEIFCRAGEEEMQIEMLQPCDRDSRYGIYVGEGAGELSFDKMQISESLPIFWGTFVTGNGSAIKRVQLASNDPMFLLTPFLEATANQNVMLERAIPRKGMDSRWLQKRSPEEIETLKQQWLNDPCWHLPATEGYEAYWHELSAFENQAQTEWTTKSNAKKFNDAQKAIEMGLPGIYQLLLEMADLQGRHQIALEYLIEGNSSQAARALRGIE